MLGAKDCQTGRQIFKIILCSSLVALTTYLAYPLVYPTNPVSPNTNFEDGRFLFHRSRWWRYKPGIFKFVLHRWPPEQRSSSCKGKMNVWWHLTKKIICSCNMAGNIVIISHSQVLFENHSWCFAWALCWSLQTNNQTIIWDNVQLAPKKTQNMAQFLFKFDANLL